MNFLVKHSLTVLGILLVITFTSKATSYTWTGTSSTAWETPGNWTVGGVTATTTPGSLDTTDNVTIGVCTGNAPSLNSTVKIAAFTMSACTLTINTSYALNITGTTSITGNGTLITGGGALTIGASATPVTVTIGSTSVTAGPTISSGATTIYASLYENWSYIYNSTLVSCAIYWLGDGISNNGGNTFSGTTYIGFSGYGGLTFGVNAGDTFEGQVTFSNTGSGASNITLSSNHSSTFNCNIIVACASVSGYGIVFGSPTGSAISTLGSGYTITAGTSTKGFVNFYNFIQEGNTAQTLSNVYNITFGTGTVFNGALNVSGSYLYFNPGAIFNNTITASATVLYLNGSNFTQTSNFTFNGSNYSNGGNTFGANVTMTSYGSAYLNYVSSDTYEGNAVYNNYGNFFIGTNVGNTYAGNVTFNQYSTAGNLYPSYKGATSYNGDTITFNSTVSSRSTIFGNAGGTSTFTGKIAIGSFAAGALQFDYFTQLGASAPQNITLTGSSSIAFGPGSVFQGAVTVSAPSYNLAGTHFENALTITKTGTTQDQSGGGNIFDGAVTLTYASGAAGGYLSLTSPDVFNSTFTLTNSSTAGIMINRYTTASNTYNGTVTFTDNSGYITASYYGSTTYNGNVVINGSTPQSVYFGQNGGTSVFGGSNNQSISSAYSGGITFTGGITMSKSSGSLLTLNSPIALNGAPLILEGGTIVSSSSVNSLTLNSTATVVGGSVSSFIYGPVSKVGNTAFTFPVGAGTTYAPVDITAATESNSRVQAEYFNTAPSGSLSGATLSTCQYWTLTRTVGSSSITPTFHWNPTSCEQVTATVLSLANNTSGNSGSWTTVSSPTVAGENSEGSITSAPSSTLGQFAFARTAAVPCSSDVSENWVEEIHYDENNNIISDTRTYADGMGRTIQTQSQNLETNNILATATIYDTYGRAVIQTLPAAITTTCFSYNSAFVKNNVGNPYSYNDFDVANSTINNINSPNPVSASCSLGTYYSTTNPELVATSGYPYSRVFYNDTVPGGMVKAASAGENLKMGSGNERQAIVLPLLNELDNNYLVLRNNYFVPVASGSGPQSLAYKGIKTIAIDENGNGSVTFKSKEGQTLATAITNSGTANSRTVSLGAGYYYYNNPQQGVSPNLTITGPATISGESSGDYYYQWRSTAPFNVNYGGVYGGETQNGEIYSIYYYYLNSYNSIKAPGNSSVDIYSSGNNVSISSVNPTTDIIMVTNLVTGAIVYNGTVSSYSGVTAPGPGFYRIALTHQGWASSYSASEVTVNYTDNFANWAYYFYDNAGHLVAQTAPNGVNLNSTASPSFTTTYTYDTQGRVLSKTDPDRGNTQYVYRQDGKLRFSQNSLQSQFAGGTGRFTFINYDSAGRSVATGEYFDQTNSTWVFENQVAADQSSNHNGINSLLTFGTDRNLMLQNNGSAKCSTVVYSHYDLVDPNCPGTQTQTFVDGMVSSTIKKNCDNDPSSSIVSQTWYSYDEFGRIGWTVQNVNGLSGSKTMNYTYGLNSNLLTATYQQNNSEQFIHKYTYNGNLQEDMVQTAQGANGSFIEQAQYFYYNYGALERTELGGNLQGLDYTYTINGWLKAINNPTMSADPGGDGISTGVNSHPNFQKDVFGMTLEYYDSDYLRTGTNFQTTSNLGSLGFSNQYNGNIRSTVWATTGYNATAMAQYAYTYDSKSQLLSASYGSNALSNGSPGFTQDPNNIYLVNNITYDPNGNLLSLKRYDNNGIAENKDNIQYTYQQSGTPNNMLQSTVNPQAPSATRTYTYDAIGRMTSFVPANTSEITKYFSYDVFGNVTAVYREADMKNPIITFVYDDRGHRLGKLGQGQETWYVRDAAGNVLSIYDNDNVYGIMQQAEVPIYGKGRIGTFYNVNGNNNPDENSPATYDYEINDHLGNVRATVSTTGGTFGVVYYADFYPHGGYLPGRAANLQFTRYGYQGQYAEVDGETGLNAFDLRMYDPVTTRMISPDPMNQYWSPYMAMGNNFTNSTDPTGGKTIIGKMLSNWTHNEKQGFQYFATADQHWSHYVRQHKQVFEDIGMAAAMIALAVVTDGAGDAVLAEMMGYDGSEEEALAIEAAAEDGEASPVQVTKFAKFLGADSDPLSAASKGALKTGKYLMGIVGNTISGGVNNGVSGWLHGDRGLKIWRDMEVGGLSSAVGAAAGGLFELLGEAPKGYWSKFAWGALKGVSEAGAKGLTGGFMGGVADGGNHFGQDLSLGLFKMFTGLPGGALGTAGDTEGGDDFNFTKFDGIDESQDDITDVFFGKWLDKQGSKAAGTE